MVAADKLCTAEVKNCSTVIWWCVCAASYCRAGCPSSRISEWELWCVWWCWTSWGSNNWRNHCLYTPPEGRGAEEWSDSHGNTLFIHIRNLPNLGRSQCVHVIKRFWHVNKGETFFMKCLSGTMLCSSGAGLAMDTRKTLMPDSLASVAACSRSSDGQPSISTTITRGWPRLDPFSWVKKVFAVCMMALPAGGPTTRQETGSEKLPV